MCPLEPLPLTRVWQVPSEYWERPPDFSWVCLSKVGAAQNESSVLVCVGMKEDRSDYILNSHAGKALRQDLRPLKPLLTKETRLPRTFSRITPWSSVSCHNLFLLLFFVIPIVTPPPNGPSFLFKFLSPSSFPFVLLQVHESCFYVSRSFSPFQFSSTSTSFFYHLFLLLLLSPTFTSSSVSARVKVTINFVYLNIYVRLLTLFSYNYSFTSHISALLVGISHSSQ